MFVFIPLSRRKHRSFRDINFVRKQSVSRLRRKQGLVARLGAQDDGEPARGSLERAFERDAVSVAVELSAWAERPGVYHPEVSSRARWASVRQQTLATAALATPSDKGSVATTAAETALETTGEPASASASTRSSPVPLAPADHSSSHAGNTCNHEYDPCDFVQDSAASNKEATSARPSLSTVSTASPVYYRRKQDHSSVFSSPLSSYMDRCIWCEGAGARFCPWCHGAGCRYKAVFPTYDEMTELMERARAGDDEARERLQNPSTMCRPCPVCEGKGMLPCKRCHGTGTNHL
ncbi:hypothetical protein CCYA_CCYA11G3204 [Cyanidiococcus yangmingshanensis]|uniref:Uncharacterized protein n=1 Tax=Cyanidiococcus yangmingshanensis TaxID=2690220 RepID=A0A7J7IH88_9RHOD|nr:hypothetical protein F1559_000278 [Cyanidiococcus yangmingshanensis]KAK4532347.1 hypothetical protein CCYA_CCYA11G3204 [Cyanidiococcus yangmingshanensis]